MAETPSVSPAREQLYRANILEHYKHPHHWKKLDRADLTHLESNPTCGDEIGIELRVDKKGRISEVGLTGAGCAISTASASMLSDRLVGLSLEEAAKISKEQVLGDLGIDPGPTRMRCALLGLEGLRKALKAGKKE
ncbi:Iron-sulfur cluster assembly scaffold protein IscU 2 [uncultured archaeon]|nr:Iron-sulfur cluster assembly scaffold protein IscU 2 [uncultured archaeon]